MKKRYTLPASEITPEEIYLNRRAFMKTAALATGAAAMPSLAFAAPEKVDDRGDPATSYESITTYNNFYEFSLDKEKVSELAKGFKTNYWKVNVGGHCKNPKVWDIDELKKKFGSEERIYRLRCVEAWSMVIPWDGFALADLIKAAEPTAKAKFVRFETIATPEAMPGLSLKAYPWPYVEGLRLDEAMNELSFLATGLYGKPLPPQNGAPIRLVTPWKYGFKQIKSIVKIDFVEEMPTSLWMKVAPREYGFYANVNPNVDHPRWSQKSERRIGEWGRRKTHFLNGYVKETAALYKGMDLKVNF